MFGSNPFKKDPLVEAVIQVHKDNELRRQAEAIVNEEFGVYNRNGVVRENLEDYDSYIEYVYEQLKEEKDVPDIIPQSGTKSGRVSSERQRQAKLKVPSYEPGEKAPTQSSGQWFAHKTLDKFAAQSPEQKGKTLKGAEKSFKGEIEKIKAQLRAGREAEKERKSKETIDSPDPKTRKMAMYKLNKSSKNLEEDSHKMADKDYDRDGKIESSKDEVWGSRLRAAKMAGKLKEEQLDEISKERLKKYLDKIDDAEERGVRHSSKRKQSASLAIGKLAHSVPNTFNPSTRPKVVAKEETQIDEISHQKAGDYIKKSARSMANAKSEMDYNDARGNKKEGNAAFRKYQKRSEGIRTAVNKLTGPDDVVSVRTKGTSTRFYEENLSEKAPPGGKYERMVKHIKKGFEDDGVSKREKRIAYATAWKAYKKKHVKEEDSSFNSALNNSDKSVAKSKNQTTSSFDAGRDISSDPNKSDPKFAFGGNVPKQMQECVEVGSNKYRIV